MRSCTTHHSGVAFNLKKFQTASFEYFMVGPCMFLIIYFETGLVPVKAVTVFHRELTRPQYPALWSGLVSELCLYLIPGLRQVPVGTYLHRCKPGNDLFMGHSKTHISSAPILQPEHLIPDLVPPSGFFPYLGRMKARHRYFLRADRIHFFPDNIVYLFHDP
ncbi:hypothetical protein BMS3Abin09_01164 [bacterium BMS3Abin09]|nr:hypothetical protein BMS3Abin09_01164 [bacterium BMS3Abin09]